MADEFCLKMPDFHVTFGDLLHAVNLRHGTNGFTSLTKEGVLRIFSPWKIRRLRPDLNNAQITLYIITYIYSFFFYVYGNYCWPHTDRILPKLIAPRERLIGPGLNRPECPQGYRGGGSVKRQRSAEFNNSWGYRLTAKSLRGVHKGKFMFIWYCRNHVSSCNINICSPTRYTTFVMVEYLFTICLTARHVADLQVHPQERL